MALWLIAPAAMMSSMIGRTLAANRRAFAFTAAVPRLAASGRLGLPRRFPRRLAAARAALVRSMRRDPPPQWTGPPSRARDMGPVKKYLGRKNHSWWLLIALAPSHLPIE